MSWKWESQRKQYGRALVELGKERSDVVVLDADLSSSTRTADFAAAFPERFFNCGIAEQNMMDTAAGLAASGKTVFASTFAVFGTGRCYDQIRQSIAYPRLNIKIVASHAGITVGGDGASHQIIEDISLMRVLPNMTVIVPVDANETYSAVKAMAATKGPVYIRIGRADVPTVTEPDVPFDLKTARVMRDGSDISLIGCGIMVSKCLEAADKPAHREAARPQDPCQGGEGDRRCRDGRGAHGDHGHGQRGGDVPRGELPRADEARGHPRRVRGIGLMHRADGEVRPHGGEHRGGGARRAEEEEVRDLT
jgi:transketolase C-terminal domain/subunit